MAITQITTTEIFMEEDSTTTVETLHLVESVVLSDDAEDVGGFTPMFAPLFLQQLGETA